MISRFNFNIADVIEKAVVALIGVSLFSQTKVTLLPLVSDGDENDTQHLFLYISMSAIFFSGAESPSETGNCFVL